MNQDLRTSLIVLFRKIYHNYTLGKGLFGLCIFWCCWSFCW